MASKTQVARFEREFAQSYKKIAAQKRAERKQDKDSLPNLLKAVNQLLAKP